MAEHRRRIFDLEGDDLYALTAFGATLWTGADRDEVVAAWLTPARRERCAQSLGRSGHVAVLLDPPARFDGKPFAFHASVAESGVTWKEPVRWVAKSHLPAAEGPARSLDAWPDDFAERFAADVGIFSGVEEIISPLFDSPIAFDKPGSGQGDNQLLDLVAYLRAGHEALGFSGAGRFELEEQRFEWRGIPQSNVILRVRGSLPAARNGPVILSGHIDKAIAEERSRSRAAA